MDAIFLPEQPSAQGVFDAVVRHAARMPGKCYLEGGEVCAYRNINIDNACFVGGLLTDDEAEGLDQEVMTVRDLARRDLLPSRLLDHVELLFELQRVHDGECQHHWPTGLRQVATEQGLKADLVGELFPA